MQKNTASQYTLGIVPLSPPPALGLFMRQHEFDYGPEFARMLEDEIMQASDDPAKQERIRLRWLNKEKLARKMVEVALWDCGDSRFDTASVEELNPEIPKHVNLLWALVWIFDISPDKIKYSFDWACEEAGYDANAIRRVLSTVRRQALMLVLRTLSKHVGHNFAKEKADFLLDYVNLTGWQQLH